jgi:hypothetical protein
LPVVAEIGDPGDLFFEKPLLRQFTFFYRAVNSRLTPQKYHRLCFRELLRKRGFSEVCGVIVRRPQPVFLSNVSLKELP